VQCYRHEEPIRGVKEDLYLRRKYFYKRPGCDTFVQQLAAHGAFEVAVYSSMMRHNLLDGLDAILPGCQRMYRALDRCAPCCVRLLAACAPRSPRGARG
jgi:hypothetical protein